MLFNCACGGAISVTAMILQNLGETKVCYRWFLMDHLEGGQITAVATPKTSPLLTGPYLLLKGKHQRNYMRIRHCIKHTSTLHQGIHPPVHGIAPIITLQPKMAFRHQQVRNLVSEKTCIIAYSGQPVSHTLYDSGKSHNYC